MIFYMASILKNYVNTCRLWSSLHFLQSWPWSSNYTELNALTEVFRGKCFKLNFTITFKHGDHDEKLSKVHNIDNLVEARFKSVYSGRGATTLFMSLKKHALAKYTTVKVKSSNSDIPNNSRQWLCTENWMEWEKIKTSDWTKVEVYYYSTTTFFLTVSKEKSFTVTAEKIYEDVDFTDFTLNTSDGSVSVHKAWLSAHSDVFKAMLLHEWKETAEGHVTIEGVTLQTLQHLKQYMYLGTLPDDGLRPLLLLARYYMMDELESECISKLARTATSENLDDLLNFAAENKVPELTFAILDMTPREVVDAAQILRKVKAVSEKES